MTKILFIHNTAMWYRRPFFKRLNKIYNIKFVFTNMQISNKIYGVKILPNIEGLDGVNYVILKHYLGIPLGVFNELKKEYDIIIGGYLDIICFIVAKLRKKPFIIWSEGWDYPNKTLKRRLVLSVIGFIVSHSDAFLVPGTKHKEFIISLGAAPNKVFIMPNVSDISAKIEDDRNLEKLYKEMNINNKKVILYVGRLVRRKGVEYLIKAFSRLIKDGDDYILVIVGRGECKNELELLSKNLNIQNNVYYVGYVEDKLLSAYYLLCDIFVIPSITYGMADPCPLTVNEAMYFGKPVIATNAVGASFDMIKDGLNGYIVQEKDSNALYRAMKNILSDYKLEKNMGKESKRIINKGYDYEHMINGFSKAVEFVSNKGV